MLELWADLYSPYSSSTRRREMQSSPYRTRAVRRSWGRDKQGPSNVATKGGVGSKNDRRAGTHFFEPGGYKIEPLLTKMVNDDRNK